MPVKKIETRLARLAEASEASTSVEIKTLIQEAAALSKRFRVDHGKRFRLAEVDPGDTLGFSSHDKRRAEEALTLGIAALADLQDKLYAQGRWAVLLIFQAMDAAGKDSAIKHVMSGVNPQGCEVHSFKAPTSEELDHDYLWRCLRRLPPRGRIGIFNRSYYEDTLVVRVHSRLLAAQRIPSRLIGKSIWEDRHRDIRKVERYLANNGVVIRKFFLHVSKREQKKRFLERLANPEKHWKFSADDVKERGFFTKYMAAYEDMIRRTARPHAPWYVVPADNKWFTRLVVVAALVETLAGLDLHYPNVGPDTLKELARAKRALSSET